MNCAKIKETILTDYLDELVSPERKKEIILHIASCPDCCEFAEVARKITLEPFARAQKKSLSRDAIWQRLVEEIETEHQPVLPSNPFSPIMEKFILGLRNPALSLGLSFILFIAAVFLTQRIHVEKSLNEEEKIENLTFVLAEITVDTDDPNESNYGTAIEEYFL